MNYNFWFEQSQEPRIVWALGLLLEDVFNKVFVYSFINSCVQFLNLVGGLCTILKM